VLDDSAVARAAATKLLTERGLVVVAISSVEEASAIDASSLGAAVLDAEVGEASGIDFAIALRAKDGTLPIAFLTGTSNPAIAASALRLGPVFSKTAALAPLADWVVANGRH